MTPELLTQAIRKYCIDNANPENVIKYSRYFKDSYNGWGLTSPQMHSFVKELLKKGDIDLKLLMEVSPDLLYNVKYEETTIFLLLMEGLHRQYSKETFFTINSWFEASINNWAHADTLGMLILPRFINKNMVTINDFKPWLTSQHKFQRRCVPVTFIKVIKYNKNESFQPYFVFLESLITDVEREVHQGMGWFLREAWKIKPSETENFLLKWKDLAPRLIIQYATEKMTQENKLKFKKNKN